MRAVTGENAEFRDFADPTGFTSLIPINADMAPKFFCLTRLRGGGHRARPLLPLLGISTPFLVKKHFSLPFFSFWAGREDT